MATRRRFGREFKVEAVKLVCERGVTITQAARDLDVHVNVLRKWVRAHREDPEHSFPGHGQQTPKDAEVTRASMPGGSIWRPAGRGSRRGSRVDDPTAYHAEGVVYLGREARFEHLLALSESAQVGKALNDAMKAIERDNPELKDALPRRTRSSTASYSRTY